MSVEDGDGGEPRSCRTFVSTSTTRPTGPRIQATRRNQKGSTQVSERSWHENGPDSHTKLCLIGPLLRGHFRWHRPGTVGALIPPSAGGPATPSLADGVYRPAAPDTPGTPVLLFLLPFSSPR